MAESILFNTVEKILGNVTSLAVEECCLAWGLQSDLKRLETSLSIINAVILDAEEKQVNNNLIAIWLRQLKHILYDAEDVLDEFAYEVLRTKVVNTHGDLKRKVRHFFSSSNPGAYRLRIGHKIKDIRQRLNEIAAYKAQFNLVDRLDNGWVQLREREMTHSFVNTSDVIGRDGDMETIVEFLMDDSHGLGENVSVISIVGIGGLGKTALAQMDFNDQRVVGHFDSKVWVCLGDVKKFNVSQVMTNIVKSLTRKKSIDDLNLEQLHQVIRENLQNKRFLLVLDDLWDVDRSRWLTLKALFACGVEGSKIIVTTRNKPVGSCVGTVAAHNLEGLPHMDCVSLFKKLAFASEAEVDEDLMKIGDEIVKKCKGVPLAVRFLGSLLYLKPDVRDWLLVKDSRLLQIAGDQNDILPILQISYDHLSSHLKQCFVYCSIFPEDYVFVSDSLIQFWMAHGLLGAPKKKQEGKEISTSHPEYVGEQYIKELRSRGFFQNYSIDFKMHDLVRELACSIGGEEFAVINVNEQNIGENVRHAWFEVQKISTNLSNVGIQSVLVPYEGFGATNRFVEACITKFKHLKFLALAHSEFEELPRSIDTLKHLRSLNLTDCIRLKKLPNSICKLHNLETLLLRRCTKLEELPKHIGELISLRTLEITTKQKQLPKKNGIGCLTSLHILRFYECPNLEILFEETHVAQLTSLGTLEVERCGSLISMVQMSSSTPMNYCLPTLEVLCVGGCRNLNLNSLHFSSLRSLTFWELPQLENTCPQWIQGCASTLQFLNITSCENLVALPEWLPNLTSLRTLIIRRGSKLVTLPQGIERLTALKVLEIFACGELSRRCKKERGGEDWPKIAHVPNIRIYP